ncbi:MAG: methyltransferase domain-containing protein [Alphaproteobacteria bacterium]|nr:SAM-dependent methyltransferase [Hyphomonas sp.]MBR9807243.1 methyltransferase domain-containing protein [Alphaproteobacteria bacterium]
MSGITEDTVYQGRVKLFQPEKGFRAGTDSLMLTAALPEKPQGHALEVGCGCGGALMTAAFRLPGVTFTGIDIDDGMASLARQAADANSFTDRVSVETSDAGLWVRGKENRFDLVFSNPPYFQPGRITAPGEGKQAAYLESLSLESWIKAMAFAARPRAPLVMIHRAAELARILSVFERQTGDITVLPIASKQGEEARRVLVRGRKGLKRGPVRLLAPLVTHQEDGTASAALEAIRHGLPIAW